MMDQLFLTNSIVEKLRQYRIIAESILSKKTSSKIVLKLEKSYRLVIDNNLDRLLNTHHVNDYV